MKYAIIISEKDSASMNIKESLEAYNFPKEVKIYLVKEESIYQENIDEKINADYFIFATRHQSAAGKKSLTCHIPGNFSKSEVGGKEKELCIAPASLLKTMFLNLKKNAKDFESEITLEVTHHGPLLRKKPCMFIEIGSTEKDWSDKRAGGIIAKTIFETLSNDIKEYPCIIGFGGNHYCVSFNKIELESNYAFSHICPSYMLDALNEDTFKQMIKRSKEKVILAVIDWKGCNSEQRIKVLEFLEKYKIEWKKSKDL
ncbi:hypothetical protein J4468_00325 [Candidatus Woesearchaeota archaeon]|nr:hypothetical protein [Candidatus Woesearchaeota archaeon]